MAGKSPKAREIGARIALARKETGGMAQRELGELIGVSERSVAAYETGEVIPYRFMVAIGTALGVDPAWIMHGDDANDVRDEQLDEVLKLLRAIKKKLDAS